VAESIDTKISWKDKYIYAVTAGCLGGLSVLLGGCASKAILPVLDGVTTQFEDPFTWAALGGMLVTIILQTDFLNKAMIQGETMSVFPVFEACWISFGVASGIMFYNPSVPWGSDLMEGGGMIPMIIGCYFMMQHTEKQKMHHRDSLMTPASTPINYYIRTGANLADGSNPGSVGNTIEEGLLQSSEHSVVADSHVEVTRNTIA